MPPPPQTVRAWVGLGANVGDRAGAIASALEALAQTPGVSVVAVSRVRETAPVGPVRQGPYLNAAAMVDTTLDARALLGVLLEIERSLGRDRAREQRWGPRTIDLDLLVFGEARIDEPGLTVPHPRIAGRVFVLEPMADLDAGLVVPGLGEAVGVLLDRARTKEDAG